VWISVQVSKQTCAAALCYWTWAILNATSLSNFSTSLGAIWSYGLGKQYEFNTVWTHAYITTIAALYVKRALTANAAQVGLSVMVQGFKNQMGTMLVARE